MSDEEKIDDLKHKVLEQKLQGVKGQVMSLADTMHERMNSMDSKHDTEFTYLKEVLDDIRETTKATLSQARATNGRVTVLEGKVDKVEESVETEIPEKIEVVEKHTKVIRFMHKYPTVTVILGVTGYLMTISEIRAVVGRQLGDFFQWVGRIF